jgi:hypothetical protein
MLAVFGVPFAMRVLGITTPEFVMLHVSNFAITGLVFLIAGYSNLVSRGFTHKRLIVELGLYAMINVVFELFINVQYVTFDIVTFEGLNTSDPLDLVYGLLAVMLLYFVIMKNSVVLPKAKKTTKKN